MYAKLYINKEQHTPYILNLSYNTRRIILTHGQIKVYQLYSQQARINDEHNKQVHSLTATMQLVKAVQKPVAVFREFGTGTTILSNTQVYDMYFPWLCQNKGSKPGQNMLLTKKKVSRKREG